MDGAGVLNTQTKSVASFGFSHIVMFRIRAGGYLSAHLLIKQSIDVIKKSESCKNVTRKVPRRQNPTDLIFLVRLTRKHLAFLPGRLLKAASIDISK